MIGGAVLSYANQDEESIFEMLRIDILTVSQQVWWRVRDRWRLEGLVLGDFAVATTVACCHPCRAMSGAMCCLFQIPTGRRLFDPAHKKMGRKRAGLFCDDLLIRSHWWLLEPSCGGSNGGGREPPWLPHTRPEFSYRSPFPTWEWQAYMWTGRSAVDDQWLFNENACRQHVEAVRRDWSSWALFWGKFHQIVYSSK